MSTTFKHLSLVTASLLFIGCGGGDNTTTDTTTDTTPDVTPDTTTEITNTTKNITITEDNQIEDLGKATNVKATVDIGDSPKSVYVLFSNESETTDSYPTATDSKIVEANESKKESSLDTASMHAKRGTHAPAYIQAFSKNVKKLLKNSKYTQASKKVISNLEPSKDVAGETQPFYIEQDTSKSTQATARKVVSNIDTEFGTKTLNIWVSDDSFFSLTDDSVCSKTKCVTQEMVDALAETFLKSGLNNDIYDWVTNIYGEEWDVTAQNKYDYLIGSNDEITILLTDIDNDNSENGGTIGYFYAKDNINNTDVSGSNERVMFYIDAVMFANGEGIWSIDDAWPKETVSTLAHEFVHMIEFYQKTLMLIPDDGENTDTWLNEMMAETTEDIVATKIESKGPRGVLHTDGSAGSPNNPEGRYGLFNEYNTFSLTNWRALLADYSKVNAYGTFLTRNYGGAQVLHDIMHNAFWDEKAVEDAVNKAVGVSGKTFADLQKEWGIAVMLSDNDNLAPDKPTYNTGDFTDTIYNGKTYELGSINFFNYATQPSFSNCTSVKPQGNCYYKVGDNLTGSVTIDLTLNATTSATLIVK